MYTSYFNPSQVCQDQQDGREQWENKREEAKKKRGPRKKKQPGKRQQQERKETRGFDKNIGTKKIKNLYIIIRMVECKKEGSPNTPCM